MSHPDIDPDDARLTAYALGELDDPAERETVERLMAASPTVRAEIEQIRHFSQTLTTAFDREREEYLLNHQPADQPANLIPFPAATPRRPARWSATLLKIAATLMVLAGLAAWEFNRPPRPWPSQAAAVQARPSAESKPAVAAMSDDLRTEDRVAAAPTSPPTEERPAEPLLAMEKPGTGVDFDKSVADAGQRRDAPLPAAPAAAPPVPTPMFAMRAPARKSIEAPKPAVSSAAATGAVAKRKADATPHAQAVPSSVGGATLDRSATANAGVLADASHRDKSADEQRLAASFVRVQAQNGPTTAGVVIAPDGVILTLASVAATNGYHPITVTFRDGSAFKAASWRRLPGSGLLALKIDASGLTAAPLASAPSSETDPVLFAGVNADTGEVQISRGASAPPADQPVAAELLRKKEAAPVNFVFDAAGGLVGVSYGQEEARKTARAQESHSLHVLTAADREELKRMIPGDHK